MSGEARTLLQQALNLPPDERYQLAQQLLDSLDDAAMSPEEQAHWEEIARRSDEAHAHPERLIPWEQAKAEIEAELDRRREVRRQGGGA